MSGRARSVKPCRDTLESSDGIGLDPSYRSSESGCCLFAKRYFLLIAASLKAGCTLDRLHNPSFLQKLPLIKKRVCFFAYELVFYLQVLLGAHLLDFPAYGEFLPPL